jgi:hypothetical protein
MGWTDSLLKYIQHSEKLIIVTLTVAIAGVALFALEWLQVFNFSGLPEWVRPGASILWTVSVVHVAVRSAMVMGTAFKRAACFLVGVPERRRKAAYQRPLIKSLRATTGMEREVLCYALREDEEIIWVRSPAGDSRWVGGLKQKGLLKVEEVRIDTVGYRIHPAAWAYMRSYPNKFINQLEWPDPPWDPRWDENRAEHQIQKKTRSGWAASLTEKGDHFRRYR